MAAEWHEADVEFVALALRQLLGTSRAEGGLEKAKEARQWADRLGLHAMGRMKNRWLLPEDEAAQEVAKQADATVIRLVSNG